MIEKLKGSSAIALLVGTLTGAGGTALILKQGKVEPTYNVHGLDFRREPGTDGGVTVTAYGTMRLGLADGGTSVTDLGAQPCEILNEQLATKAMNDAEACLR